MNTPNPNPSPELLPCPFCGGEAVITIDRGRDTVGIECRKCTAHMTPSWSMASEVWARRSWNTRVSQTLPAPGEVDFRALLIEAGRNAGAYIDDRVSDDFLKVIPEEVRLKIASLATVAAANDEGVFSIGDRVEKIKGSSWCGIIVGTYSTKLTPEGYAVESEREPGSVQIYPAAAIRLLSQGVGK